MAIPPPFHNPILRDDLPQYPPLIQAVRVTGGTIPGPSGYGSSSFIAPSLYVGFVQQLRTETLLPRDREPCLILDLNGNGLATGYYTGRLAGSYQSLPIYAVGECCDPNPTNYSSNINNVGSSTSLTIAHNLGTSDLLVQVRDNGTGEIVYPTVTVGTTEPYNVVVSFVTAPDPNKYRVTILQGGDGSGAGGIQDGDILTSGLTFPVNGLKLTNSSGHVSTVTIGGTTTGPHTIIWNYGNTDRTITIPGDGPVTFVVTTGVSGGQTIIGSTSSGGNLTLQGTSHSTQGSVLVIWEDSGTNNVTSVLDIRRTTSGTAAAGFGSAITVSLENAGSALVVASKIQTAWTTATAGAEFADVAMFVLKNGVLTENLRLLSSGGLRMPTLATTPSTPSAGYGIVYLDTVDGLTYLDDAGVLVAIGTETGLLLPSITTPATPDSGYNLLFVNTATGDLTLLDDTGTTTTFGGVGTEYPKWVKVTKTYSDLSAAGTTNDIEVYSLPAKGYLLNAFMKTSTAFSGGAIVSYNLDLGITGSLTRYAFTYSGSAAVSNSNYAGTNSGTLLMSNLPDFQSFAAATSIRLQATSMGANLNAATAGSVDIWLLVSTLP